jgi:hypothetical protein
MAHNIRAVRLYERMGFSVEGRRCECLLVDGTFVDELTMAVILPASVRLAGHPQARPGSECTTTQIACTTSPVLLRYSCGVEESNAIESPGPSS